MSPQRDSRQPSWFIVILLLLGIASAGASAAAAGISFPVGFLHGFPWCRCNTTSPQPFRMEYLGTTPASVGGLTSLSFRLSTLGTVKPFNVGKIYLPMSEFERVIGKK